MNPFVANMLLPEWNAGSMTSSNIFVSTIFRFLNVSLFSFWTFHFFSSVCCSVSVIAVTVFFGTPPPLHSLIEKRLKFYFDHM